MDTTAKRTGLQSKSIEDSAGKREIHEYSNIDYKRKRKSCKSAQQDRHDLFHCKTSSGEENLKLSVFLCFAHQSRKILIVVVRRWLRKVDVVIEAAGYLLFTEILQDAEIASLIVVYRVAWALMIGAGAEFFGVSHFIHLLY